VTLDTHINNRSTALKKSRKHGRKIIALAIASAMAVVGAELLGLSPWSIDVWALLATTLVFVFGASCCMTSSSYISAELQPPYPAHGSAHRIKRHLHYESLLAKVANTAFSSQDGVEMHTTEEMRKLRVLRMALRAVNKCEQQLEDARWKVAMLQSETQLTGNYDAVT
jgi:hypothetical protein